MKITKTQLRQIIKEELESLDEAAPSEQVKQMMRRAWANLKKAEDAWEQAKAVYEKETGQSLAEELKEAWIDVLDPESDIAPHKHAGDEADAYADPEVEAESDLGMAVEALKGAGYSSEDIMSLVSDLL